MSPQECAREAAIFADAFGRNLLAASCPHVDRIDQRHHIVEAFRIWRSLCVRMAALEQVAPACREEGYAEAQKAFDFIEGRAA